MNKKMIIAGILVVIILIVGVGVWKWNHMKGVKVIKQDNSKQAKNLNNDVERNLVESRVNDFYNKYIELEKVITGREDNGRTEAREALNLLLNEYVDEGFKKKISDGNLQSNQVFCAQEIPTCVETELKEINRNEAVVLNHEYFSGQTCRKEQELVNEEEVILRLIDDQWKIYDIVCASKN